jgi:hypothetical protein
VEPPSRKVIRALRVDPDLWNDAKRQAEDRGETVTDAITRFLRHYARGDDDTQ